MDLLITVVILITAFMVFGSLFIGAIKVFSKRKSGFADLTMPEKRKSLNVRINKTHNVYSFK